MNYFPFHVGDYASHTGHLEPMEDLAYRRLLDQYYLREGPLPADIQASAKLVRLRSCAADVESVLHEFFTLTDDGWRHDRCEMEIAEMKHRQLIAKAKADKRWDMLRSERSIAAAMLQHGGINAVASINNAVAMLPTPTPTPTPKKEREKRAESQFLLPDWIPPEPWGGYVEMRKNKKLPMSERAMQLKVNELEKLRAMGQDVTAVLDKSTSNCWTDIYAIKDGRTGITRVAL